MFNSASFPAIPNFSLPSNFALDPTFFLDSPKSENSDPYSPRTTGEQCEEPIDISKRKFVQKFLENLDPSFKKIVIQFAKKARFQCQNLTYPELYLPNTDALKFEATRYKTKYNISLNVLSEIELNKFIKERVASPTESFEGVIVYSSSSSLHVTPIVFSFHLDTSKNECAILDTISLYQSVKQIIIAAGIEKKSIFYGAGKRIVDSYSCRTGSLTLLRDTLLSLRHHKHTCLATPLLSDGECKGKEIIYLPPEWNPTEQVSNPRTQVHHLVIRRFYSQKQKSQLTVTEYRKKYTKPVEMKCRIISNHVMDESSAGTIQIPKGVQLLLGSKASDLEFTISLDINIFLIQKSMRNEARYKAALK